MDPADRPAPDRVGRKIDLRALARELYRETLSDDLAGEAAKLAFYFFFSLFPALLVLFALTGLFGGPSAFGWIVGHLSSALPGPASAYLEEMVREITGESRPGILSLGILLTLWSASNIFASLAQGLNRMYDLERGRSWWRRRLVAIASLVVGSLLLLASATALLAGPAIVREVGLGAVWTLLRWPLAFLVVSAMTWLVYLVLPHRNRRGALVPTLAGALIGSSLWLLATVAFRLYVIHFPSFARAYGVVGGILVLLLWLYLSALALLFGGEVAATLEQRRGAGGG